MSKKVSKREIIINTNEKEVERLKAALLEADRVVDELNADLEKTKNENASLNDYIGNKGWINDVIALKAELRNFKQTSQVAKQELQSFLETANLVTGDGSVDVRFKELFQNLEKGAMTVGQAMAKIKTDYAHLFQENFGKTGGVFDVRIFQNLDAALKNVSETLTVVLQKVEQIQTEGVKTSGGGGGGGSAVNIAQMFDQIRASAEQMSETANHSLDNISNLVGALGKYATLSETKLLAVSQAFRNMADLHSGSFSSGSVDNIIKLAKGLTELYKPYGSSLKFDFTGLKDFKVSPTIKHLNEFLNQVTGDQIAMLERIGKVDLANISTMKGGTTFQHLNTLMQSVSGDGIQKLKEIGTINLDNLANIKLSKAVVDNLLRLFNETGGGSALSGLIDAAKATEDFGNKSSKAAKQTDELRQKITEITHVEEVAAQDIEHEALAVEQMSERTSNASTALVVYNRELNNVAGTIAGSHLLADLMAAAQARQQQAATNAAYAQELYRLAMERTTLSSSNASTALVVYNSELNNVAGTIAGAHLLADLMAAAQARQQQAAMNAAAAQELYRLAMERTVQTLEVYRQTMGSAMAASGTPALPAGTGTPTGTIIDGEFRDIETDTQAKKENAEATREAAEATKQFRMSRTGINQEFADAIRDMENAAAAQRDLTDAERAGAAALEEETASQRQYDQAMATVANTLKNVQKEKDRLANTNGGTQREEYRELVELEKKLQNLRANGDNMPYGALLDRIAELKRSLSETLQTMNLFTMETKNNEAAARAAAQAERERQQALESDRKAYEQAQKTLVRVTGELEKWTKAQKDPATKQHYENIQRLKGELERLIASYDPSKPQNFAQALKGINSQLVTHETAIKKSGNAVRSYFSNGMSMLKSRLTYTLGLANIVMKTVNEIKKMISTAVELDSAMNTLQIVTRASGDDMEQYGKRVSAMAKETAQATKDLIDATTVYARLGYSMEDSGTLAKYTAMLQGVGGIEASAAQDAMTAIIKAFDKNVSDVEDVMDKLVVVGNNFPISVSQLAEGMNNAGSVLHVAGNSFEESLALLTAANTTVQNISKASTGLRTIAARIRKMDTEDGEIVEESKYNEMVKALTQHNVALVDANGEYRKTYDIIKDIAAVWDDLTTMQQAAVSEALSGSRQQNIFSSLITQFGEAEKAMGRMQDSAGQLQESYDIYLDSIKAHTNQMKAAFDELSRDFVDSGFAKGVVDVLTKIIECLDFIVSRLGGIGTVLSTGAIVGIIKLIKNGGIVATLAKIPKLAVEMQSAMIAAKLTGESALGLVLAAHPVVVGVTIAIAALAAALYVMKKRNDALHPSLKQLKKDLEEAEGKADSLKGSIDTNNSRIEELYKLQESGDMTLADEEELSRLKRENKLLEIQLEIERGIVQARKEAIRESVNQELDTFFAPGTDEKRYWGLEEDDYTIIHHNSGAENVKAAIDDYTRLSDAINAVQDKSIILNDELLKKQQEYAEVTAEVGEEAAKQLPIYEEIKGLETEIKELDKQRISLSSEEVSNRQYLLERQKELAQHIYDLNDATDPESLAHLEQLKELFDEIDEVLHVNDTALEKFKRRLDKVTEAVTDELGKSLDELSDDDSTRILTELMNKYGYSIDDVTKYMHALAEATKANGNAAKDSIAKYGSFKDEVNEATAALNAYEEAMKGGEKDDAIKKFQEIYQEAMEDFKAGKVDSNRVHQLAELMFSDEQLAAMDYDIAEIGKRMQSDLFQSLFGPDTKTQKVASQRMMEYIQQHAADFDGIAKVTKTSNGGFQFVYEDVKKLADALGVSENVMNMLLSQWDMYGVNVMRSRQDVEKIADGYRKLVGETKDARAAVKQMIADLRAEGNDDLDIARVLKDLSEDGTIPLSFAEIKQMIAGVGDETDTVNQKMQEVDKQEANPKVGANTDEYYRKLDGIISSMRRLNNMHASPKIDLDDGSGPSQKASSSHTQDVSKHAKGTKHAKEGLSLVNEEGPELISNNGEAYIANDGDPGFTYLEEGAIVFNARDTKKILSGKKLAHPVAANSEGTDRASLRNRLLSGGSTPAFRQAVGVAGDEKWICPYCGTVNGAGRSKCRNANCPSNRGPGNGRITPQDPGWICFSCGAWNASTRSKCSNPNCYTNKPPVTGVRPTRPSNSATNDPIQDGAPIWVPPNNDNNSSSGYGGYNDQEPPEPQKFDWIEVRLNRINRIIENLRKVTDNIFKKLPDRMEASRKGIREMQRELDTLDEAAERYMREADNVGLDASLARRVREGAIDINEYDEETRKLIDEYKQWYEKSLECRDAIDDLHTSIAELYQEDFNIVQTDFENKLAMIEHESEMINKNIDMISQKGYLDSALYYEDLMGLQAESIHTMKEELADLNEYFDEAMKSGEIEEESEAWYEMKQSINEVEEAIADANIQMVEYQKTIRQINWDTFDYAQDRFGQLTQEANFLINLMSKNKLFDDRGQFNDSGMATLGMRAVNFNAYMAQADAYAAEMAKIEQDIASDPYDTELIARREALLQLQQQSIISAEGEKSAIKDLVSQGIDAELSALKELIDAYNESLDSAKDLYEYQKKISEKSKTVADIQKQISAYTQDNSEETRAKVQKLNQDLAKAEQDLRETENEQAVAETKKILDDVYNEYEAMLNRRLDDINALMTDMIAMTNENSDRIQGEITRAGEQVGYSVSEDLTNVLQTQVANYDKMFLGITGVHDVLNNIYDMVAAMARESGAVKAYATGGLIDSTGLQMFHGTKNRPELVLNATDTQNFLAAAKLMREMNGLGGMMGANLGLRSTGTEGGTAIGAINLTVLIDHVQDYNDFVTQLRDDPKFEKLITSIAVDPLSGKSPFRKNRISF